MAEDERQDDQAQGPTGDADAPSAPNAAEPDQPDAPEAVPAAPAEAAGEPGDEAPSAPNVAPDPDAEAPADASGSAGETAAGEGGEGADAPAEAGAGEQAAAGDAADAPAEAEPVVAAAPDEPVDDQTADTPPAADAEPAAATAGAEPAAATADTDAASSEPRRQRPPARDDDESGAEPAEEVVPGAHLEPDLVLEEQRPAEGEYDPYATGADDDLPIAEGEQAADVQEAPAPARTPLDLAADARYRATGKRKRAIARVIVKPGDGTYTINGKPLDDYFPRVTLQKTARQPLETAGYASRMDITAKIHGGGVSAQAVALRHGIARALVEADPNLRGELKRHGFLTRDARVKERKKAGLKKARKRPQFSKR